MNVNHMGKTNPLFMLTHLFLTGVLLVALFHGRGNGCTEITEGS